MAGYFNLTGQGNIIPNNKPFVICNNSAQKGIILSSIFDCINQAIKYSKIYF